LARLRNALVLARVKYKVVFADASLEEATVALRVEFVPERTPQTLQHALVRRTQDVVASGTLCHAAEIVEFSFGSF
jgi:hypothetical protein